MAKVKGFPPIFKKKNQKFLLLIVILTSFYTSAVPDSRTKILHFCRIYGSRAAPLYMFLPAKDKRCSWIYSCRVCISLQLVLFFSAGVSPFTCGKWHWSADMFFFFPCVPLASDTSVPQLRISLKTFDKSRSPQGISRDSLNPQLGQTDCQRGLTDLGAVCLCGCTTTRQRRLWRAVCTVWLASAERDLIAADAEFLCVASSSHPLWPSPRRAGWLNKWRASAVESGQRETPKHRRHPRSATYFTPGYSIHQTLQHLFRVQTIGKQTQPQEFWPWFGVFPGCRGNIGGI